MRPPQVLAFHIEYKDGARIAIAGSAVTCCIKSTVRMSTMKSEQHILDVHHVGAQQDSKFAKHSSKF